MEDTKVYGPEDGGEESVPNVGGADTGEDGEESTDEAAQV